MALKKFMKDSLIPLLMVYVFHLDISDKFDNDEHPENIECIEVTLLVFHLDISNRFDNDVHS